MDNFDELDKPVISSSGRKRKIKAETFSRSIAKAARYNGEGKAQCIACNPLPKSSILQVYLIKYT